MFEKGVSASCSGHLTWGKWMSCAGDESRWALSKCADASDNYTVAGKALSTHDGDHTLTAWVFNQSNTTRHHFSVL